MLCGAILRRFGWSAVVVGGFGYAVVLPGGVRGAVGAARAARHLRRAARDPAAAAIGQRTPRLAVIAGVAGGLATGAKIWYIVPAVLLLLMAPRVRLRYLIGVAIGGCAIYLPFLAFAPQRMVQQVVLDQLGRGGSATTPGPLTGSSRSSGAHSTLGVPPAVIAPILALIAHRRGDRRRSRRAARGPSGSSPSRRSLILLLSPSWFAHYTALTAPPLALCLGVGASRLVGRAPESVAQGGARRRRRARHRRRERGERPVAATACGRRRDSAPPRRRSAGCITADDPGALIELNVLSRDLQRPGVRRVARRHRAGPTTRGPHHGRRTAACSRGR